MKSQAESLKIAQELVLDGFVGCAVPSHLAQKAKTAQKLIGLSKKRDLKDWELAMLENVNKSYLRTKTYNEQLQTTDRKRILGILDDIITIGKNLTSSLPQNARASLRSYLSHCSHDRNVASDGNYIQFGLLEHAANTLGFIREQMQYDEPLRDEYKFIQEQTGAMLSSGNLR